MMDALAETRRLRVFARLALAAGLAECVYGAALHVTPPGVYSGAAHFITSAERQTGDEEACDSLAYLDCDGDDAGTAAFAPDYAPDLLYSRERALCGDAAKIICIGAFDLHAHNVAGAQHSPRRNVNGAVDAGSVGLAAAFG
jgi:hypothetical protein